MSVILVPYHLDEYLPDLDLPVPAGTVVRRVFDPLPVSTTMTRLAFLCAAVADVVALTPRPVVVCGDCTTALGTMSGLNRTGLTPGVVWFDAHGDVHTPRSSTSGYLGGMPLRYLIEPAEYGARLGLQPVAEDRVVLVDARDLDPAEADYLSGSAVRRCAVDDLTESVLPAGPLLLHLDLDVIDDSELTGLRYPVPAGPSTRSVLAAAARVLATGRVVAMDIACTWFPGDTDPTGRRAGIVASLIEAFGSPPESVHSGSSDGP
jgi:arginase